jgi:hypothetical protein
VALAQHSQRVEPLRRRDGGASGISRLAPPIASAALARTRERSPPLRSQRDPEAQEPESPGAAVVVEVRLNTLTLPVEGLMVATSVVDATLIRPPLIRSPLVPKLVTVATVSAVIRSTVTALVALAVLWPAWLPGISRRGAETDTQPESAKADRAHYRGPRHRCLEAHCCVPFSCDLPPNRVDRSVERSEASTARDRLRFTRQGLASKGDASRMRHAVKPLCGSRTAARVVRRATLSCSIGLPIRAVTQHVVGSITTAPTSEC